MICSNFVTRLGLWVPATEDKTRWGVWLVIRNALYFMCPGALVIHLWQIFPSVENNPSFGGLDYFCFISKD